MNNERIVQHAIQSGLFNPPGKPLLEDEVIQMLRKNASLIAEDERNRLADAFGQFPFGDTSASTALWIREQNWS